MPASRPGDVVIIDKGLARSSRVASLPSLGPGLQRPSATRPDRPVGWPSPGDPAISPRGVSEEAMLASPLIDEAFS